MPRGPGSRELLDVEGVAFRSQKDLLRRTQIEGSQGGQLLRDLGSVERRDVHARDQGATGKLAQPPAYRRSARGFVRAIGQHNKDTSPSGSGREPAYEVTQEVSSATICPVQVFDHKRQRRSGAARVAKHF
jgi:hypothetical protein